ncbi:hypothetical protein R5R35_000816 [Gryllus longicercus]|uniref:Uncharacterized protein n=1 Tax=Gryllus longicercus TaxID=2509291 RepID=A0AAN9ZBC6_9ORTH
MWERKERKKREKRGGQRSEALRSQTWFLKQFSSPAQPDPIALHSRPRPASPCAIPPPRPIKVARNCAESAGARGGMTGEGEGKGRGEVDGELPGKAGRRTSLRKRFAVLFGVQRTLKRFRTLN